MITGIISGGQTGADQAFLRAAKAKGLPTGGFAPLGWRTETGPSPWLGTDYGLVEWTSRDYTERTEMNVQVSDGTLILGRRSPGSNRTEECCRIAKKPCLWLQEYQSQQAIPRFRLWVARFNIRTLNGAGNRESRSPGIGIAVETWLLEALR